MLRGLGVVMENWIYEDGMGVGGVNRWIGVFGNNELWGMRDMGGFG